MPQFRILIVSVVMVLVAGCHSFKSGAVRDLIGREGQKIDAATTNSQAVQQETAKRIELLRLALADLNTRFKDLQEAEAAHTFIFSSPQALSAKRDREAQAAAYLLGLVYLAEYEGLNRTVMDQFEEDFCTLQDLAARLGDSWKAIGDLHAGIEQYAHASFLASVDPNLVGAVLQRVPGGSAHVLQVLDRSRTVNDALEEALGLAFLRGHGLERVKGVNTDLMDLLERLSKSPK